jgi:hypothetical protein
VILKTEFDGEAITHRRLWKIVTEQAKQAVERAEGWFNPSVVAQVFAYHTVEAHLNSVGEHIAPEVWINEREYFKKESWRGAEGKLRKIVDLVGLAWTPNERPLKSILELKRIRDLIAHGKAEKLQGEVIHSPDTEPPYPESQLSGFVRDKSTPAHLISDVEKFLNAIQKRAKPLQKVENPWFGEEALKGPPWHMSGSTTQAAHPATASQGGLDQ